MVCLHPAAVTFSCVRSMSCLLSSQQSEYTPTCVCHLEANDQSPRISITSGSTCMAFARLGGEFCQAQHLLLIVDKWKEEAAGLPFTHRLVAGYSCWGVDGYHEVSEFPFRNPLLYVSLKTKFNFSALYFISGRCFSCRRSGSIH